MSADLRFDAARHEYTLGSRRVIHVTEVLGHFDEGIARAKANHAEAVLAAGDLGTAVHVACELDDRGVLDEASVDQVVGVRLEQWRKFRREKGFVPVLIEARVYHRAYDYAGTLDRMGALDGCRSLIDLKSGVVSRLAGPQTGAYKLAHEAGGGAPVERRFSLHLTEDRYFLVPHADPQDGTVFLSMLNTYKWLKAG